MTQPTLEANAPIPVRADSGRRFFTGSVKLAGAHNSRGSPSTLIDAPAAFTYHLTLR
jgi:hypothetical protein